MAPRSAPRTMLTTRLPEWSPAADRPFEGLDSRWKLCGSVAEAARSVFELASLNRLELVELKLSKLQLEIDR